MEQPNQAKDVREVPGSYGLSFFGALKDRLDYFWFQGDDEFFESRMKKYGSSVFRVNFVPGPPGYPNSKGIALLDHKSYTVLFDKIRVDKVDTFVGPFVPKLDFTGGYHVLSYLDSADEKHQKLKSYVMEVIRSNGNRYIPEFKSVFDTTFEQLESPIAKGRVSDVVAPLENLILTFMFRVIAHRDPAEPGPASLGKKSLFYLKSWMLVQYAAISHTPLPHFLEEILLRNFRLPFFLIRGNYEKICKFIRTYATEALDLAEKQYGIVREEAVHNLVFLIGLNAWFGLSRLLPSMLYHLGKTGPEFHAKLRQEIRTAVHAAGGVTLTAIDQMPLVKATALETLRMSPPAPFQYGRARSDFTLESNEAAFFIKKGDFLGGNQNFVCKDPSAFSDPQTFNPERFVDANGRQNLLLLRQVLWSNGWATDYPAPDDKQCAGKDFVELFSRIFLVNFFIRYDTFELAPGAQLHKGTNAQISLKSLTKAT